MRQRDSESSSRTSAPGTQCADQTAGTDLECLHCCGSSQITVEQFRCRASVELERLFVHFSHRSLMREKSRRHSEWNRLVAQRKSEHFCWLTTIGP